MAAGRALISESRASNSRTGRPKRVSHGDSGAQLASSSCLTREYVPQDPPWRRPGADASGPHGPVRRPVRGLRADDMGRKWASSLGHWHRYASQGHTGSQARSSGRGSEAANHGPGVASPMYEPGAGPDQISVLASPFKVTIGALRLHRSETWTSSGLGR
jgi:hypothetical protein